MLLVDDQRKNRDHAEQKGHEIIEATPYGSHIKKATHYSKAMQHPKQEREKKLAEMRAAEEKENDSSSEASKSLTIFSSKEDSGTPYSSPQGLRQSPAKSLSKSMDGWLAYSRSPSPNPTGDQPTQRMALTRSRENIK
jgi:hypothetical protein